MSETSKWDDYFVRVGRYLESRDIESEELNYKRETGHSWQLAPSCCPSQAPISIKTNNNLKNLGDGHLEFPGVLVAGDWAGGRRALWARDDL